MLFLRTAAGGFVDAATIVRLCEEATSWVAICDDDTEVASAAYYSTPGQLKKLRHLLPLSRGPAGVRKRRPVGLRAAIAPSEVV